MLLEKPHVAHTLRGNPAGRDIRDRAPHKLQPCMRDIHFVGKDRNSDCFHFRNRLSHQRQQDVQVVNHQVVDHVHIEAARREHPQPVHFKKKRPVQNRLYGDHRGIETFDMPYLQDAFVNLRRRKQRIGLREIHGHGLLDQNVKPHLHQPAAHLRMHDGGHGHAHRVGAPMQFLKSRKYFGLKFLRDRRGASRILIVYTDQLRAFDFTVHAHVIASEFARSGNGDTDLLPLCRRTHSLLVPPEASFGSVIAATAMASIVIPAASARSISFSRSKSKVRPASTARAVAPAVFICSTVGKPTTGTSKRMSCPGLLTFTTTIGFPPAIRAARAIVSSVPSIASTATHARSEITTVCPMSIPAICRATPIPYAMSSASCSFGARRVNTPGSGTSGFRKIVESTSRMPSSSSTRATAPISASVFFLGSERSSFASFQSGRMALKILLCFTCPAITACVTPSCCSSSMVLLSSPRLTQCSRFAIFSSSREASSFTAITAISMPWLRAPSRTRKGNLPFPAISPHPFNCASVSGMNSAIGVFTSQCRVPRLR